MAEAQIIVLFDCLEHVDEHIVHLIFGAQICD
jgi:hypothetical protein